MAKQTLPTNFKDDALASSMGGKRRYILTENGDGTFSLEDATTYTQVGDVLGAARLNAICKAVNESVDKAAVVDSIDEIKAITKSGYPAGALAVKQLSSDFDALTDSGAITGMDAREDGVYITYVPTAGADAVTRKLDSGNGDIKAVTVYSGRPTSSITVDVSSYVDCWADLSINNFGITHLNSTSTGSADIKSYNPTTGTLSITVTATGVIEITVKAFCFDV